VHGRLGEILQRGLKKRWIKDPFPESAIEEIDELKPIALIIG
jgi:hypothetical protein